MRPRRTSLSAVLLCVVSVVASIVTAASAQAEDQDDEFAPRPDPIFSRSPEPVLAHNSNNNNNNAGAWSDGNVSLRGLLSFQWARQDIQLGNLEYLALCVMMAYATVFVLGRRKNHEIAHSFIKGVHGLFCSRFLEAGPALEVPPQDRRQLLARDSCSSFLYYATGSRSCSGVLVRINLRSRHDLFMLIWNFFTPSEDTVTIEVSMDDDDMEPMVFAVTRKRDVKKLQQDVPHLQDYAGLTRAPSLPPGLVCLSETGVLLDPLLTAPALKILSEYPDLLELMHFTDQNEQSVLGQKETPRKLLRFRFRLPVVSGGLTGDSRGAAKMVELALYYIDLLHK